MDFLHRRAIHGPSRCCYCLTDSEDTSHLFLHCNVILDIWALAANSLGCQHPWQGTTILEAWTSWWQLYANILKMRNLPLIIAWEVWIGRNKFIFNGQPINRDRICAAIIATYNLLPANKH